MQEFVILQIQLKITWNKKKQINEQSIQDSSCGLIKYVKEVSDLSRNELPLPTYNYNVEMRLVQSSKVFILVKNIVLYLILAYKLFG